MRLSRRQLFRWMGWFTMANTVVLGLVGLRYFSGYVAGDSALAWVYLITVYFAHHVMVAVVPLFILLTPLVLLRPNRKWLTVAAVLVFALFDRGDHVGQLAVVTKPISSQWPDDEDSRVAELVLYRGDFSDWPII